MEPFEFFLQFKVTRLNFKVVSRSLVFAVVVKLSFIAVIIFYSLDE